MKKKLRSQRSMPSRLSAVGELKKIGISFVRRNPRISEIPCTVVVAVSAMVHADPPSTPCRDAVASTNGADPFWISHDEFTPGKGVTSRRVDALLSLSPPGSAVEVVRMPVIGGCLAGELQTLVLVVAEQAPRAREDADELAARWPRSRVVFASEGLPRRRRCSTGASRTGSPAGSTRRTAKTVMGRHHESGDVLVESIRLAASRGGDLLGVPATGAHRYTMASSYDVNRRIPVVFVADGGTRLAVRRETRADLLARDVD